MENIGTELLQLAEIVWINIVLSGDNAVVIAMACRGLPPDRRQTGMVLGALVAVALRIAFTVVIETLLAVPFLKIVGGGLLVWIAVKLLSGGEDEGEVEASPRLWEAVRTVAVADAVMSLDNVLAIAGVAKDSMLLVIVGLAISVPLIVVGATLIMKLLARFPILVWAGAGLLGWVAGGMLLSDPFAARELGAGVAEAAEMPASALCAAVVLGLGYLLRRRSAARPGRQVP
ncbi:TerC family protein [Aureimonas leprariae]|uniref:TerC family protein n=1 Tax=Plantimonas leprariae TaxID=2615207 RepID=A0A7V7PLF5_9HYPH|nr:TerC family protein [Aureimonas leprariae]KAB0677229.1 TerC family protein [Aureimonas leprariae]